jgi:hypothetical protein
MFTWQLWNALHGARPRHPLFRLERHARDKSVSPWRKLFEDVLPLGLLVMMVASAWMLALLVIAGFILILVVSGFLYGLIAAYGISRNLAKHRARGRYDLISLTPGGVFETNHAVSAYFLQRVDVLGYIREIMNRLYIGAAILLSLAMILAFGFTNTLMTKYSTNVFQTFLFPSILSGMLIVGLHYLDFTRSALTGILIGMITPTYTRGTSETHVFAVILYTALQLLVYGFAWATGIDLVLRGFDTTSALIMNLTPLLLAVVVREISLQGLWYLLLWRLNVSPAEAQAELYKA